MPSRKRTKGKERKAKKSSFESCRSPSDRALVRRVWQGWARGEDNNKKIVHCNHGRNVTIPDDAHPVSKFLDTLFSTGDLKSVFQLHPQLCKNESHREMAVNLLMSIAVTSCLLTPKKDYNYMPVISDNAYAIVLLENWDETDDFDSAVCKQNVATKFRDLHFGYGDESEERDLLKFFHKRIACSCLKERHSEARRTQPKLGKCFHCEDVKDRSMLMICSRCKVEHYCSHECQVAAWPEHKCMCNAYVNANTK